MSQVPRLRPRVPLATLISNAAKKKANAWKMPTPIRRWKLIRGDTVVICTGKDKGKTGQIMSVDRKYNRVWVKGLRLSPKTVPNKRGQPVLIERPVHYSNIMHVDPITKQRTRLCYQYLEDGTKVRIAKKSGAIIPKPPFKRATERAPYNSATDTPASIVYKVTFDPARDIASV